ncbi:PH domain-containing protein [bacterium]|uniref:YdbS-like PH domain-containing protein n=2 Tax=Katanobacteria TaxID=422282 RepID=A0A2M7X2C1_UNCKA|nr:PH domain-containing protein [bacterium]PIP56699.1 MAG: hypothetical protein COX05_01625 [candidate division WWE3 bacterium CG22_combo_CG10-13_8_21_14_all_39_12]PJA40324.1 MAG: hypothetical protein CO179_02685 [candidate division WWE3 bacterium CG_4_9_14_3_um_filter_39_7]
MQHEMPRILEGEEILYEGAPLPQLKKYYFYSYSLLWLFMLAMTLVGLLLFPFALLFAHAMAGKSYWQRYYWITNKRIIVRKGLFGYSISSIPLERISDVIISRGWFENFCGFGSLRIQSLAGQISSGAGGSEGDLKAIADPEEVQHIILEAVKKNRSTDRTL